MFKIQRTRKKYAYYISDYNYPVGLDTRPTITFGLTNPHFSRKYTYCPLFIEKLILQFKKWGAL